MPMLKRLDTDHRLDKEQAPSGWIMSNATGLKTALINVASQAGELIRATTTLMPLLSAPVSGFGCILMLAAV